MIPIFGTDVEVEPIVEFLGTPPPKYGITSEGLGVGGSILDNIRYRDAHTYWSAIPVGTGNGTDSRIELRYWKDGIWNFEKSFDAVFLDSAKIVRVVMAFNRTNEIFVVTEDPEGVSLSWTDPRIGERQTRAWVGGTSPVIIYDAYTSIRHPDAQVILFYIKNEKLLMRLEQEYFEIERDTGIDTFADILETGAMTKTGKVQLLFGENNVIPSEPTDPIDPNRVGIDLTGTVIAVTNTAGTHRYAGVKLDGAIGKQVFTKVSKEDSINNLDENLDIVGTPFDIFLNNGVVDASGWNGVYIRLTVVNLSTDKTVVPTMVIDSNFARSGHYPFLQSDLINQAKEYTSVGEFHTLSNTSLNAAVLTSINQGFKLSVTFHFSDKPVPSEVDIFKLGTYILDIETNEVI